MRGASSVSVSDGLYSNLEEDQGLRSTHGGLLEIGTIALLWELRRPVEGDAFAYCEGLRIQANGTIIEAIEQVRLPETLRLVNN